LNQRVSRRSVSCRASSLRNDIDLKKAEEGQSRSGALDREILPTVDRLHNVRSKTFPLCIWCSVLRLGFHIPNNIKVSKRPTYARLCTKWGQSAWRENMNARCLAHSSAKYMREQMGNGRAKYTHRSPIVRKFDLPFTRFEITTGEQRLTIPIVCV
jgi:hypothetical protein